jgi:hypothetical protein
MLCDKEIPCADHRLHSSPVCRLPGRWNAEFGVGTVDFAAGAGLEVAVDVHALVQDAHDVDDAFDGDPIKQRV